MLKGQTPFFTRLSCLMARGTADGTARELSTKPQIFDNIVLNLNDKS